MSHIKFTCPACAAGLKSADPNLAGKRIKCPRCATPFLVPVQTIQETITAAPRTTYGGSSATGRKKKGHTNLQTKAAAVKKMDADRDCDEDEEDDSNSKKSSGSGKKALIWGSVGAGLVLLFALVAVVLFVVKPFSKKPIARRGTPQSDSAVVQANAPLVPGVPVALPPGAVVAQPSPPPTPPVSTPPPPLDSPVPPDFGNAGSDKLSMMPIHALGAEERLEKLKAVRLKGKASFAEAQNINDVTLTWCWDPRITVRMEELHRDEDLAKLANLTKNLDRAAEDVLVSTLVREIRAKGQIDEATIRELEGIYRDSIRKRDFKTLLDIVLIIDGPEAHGILGNRVRVPLQPEQAVRARNLCFALSVSNLVPLKRHAFQIERGEEMMVRGKNCREFKVRSPDGVELKFYFDVRTDLLIKVAHRGNDPRSLRVSREVQWEHYFSEYQETDGIKQWRKLEIEVEGRRFATIDVTDVQYCDEMPVELQPITGQKR